LEDHRGCLCLTDCHPQGLVNSELVTTSQSSVPHWCIQHGDKLVSTWILLAVTSSSSECFGWLESLLSSLVLEIPEVWHLMSDIHWNRWWGSLGSESSTFHEWKKGYGC
jgi:hypothetical protein